MRSEVLLLTLVATTLSSAIPKAEEDHKNRVIDKVFEGETKNWVKHESCTLLGSSIIN